MNNQETEHTCTNANYNVNTKSGPNKITDRHWFSRHSRHPRIYLEFIIELCALFLYLVVSDQYFFLAIMQHLVE